MGTQEPLASVLVTVLDDSDTCKFEPGAPRARANSGESSGNHEVPCIRCASFEEQLSVEVHPAVSSTSGPAIKQQVAADTWGRALSQDENQHTAAGHRHSFTRGLSRESLKGSARKLGAFSKNFLSIGTNNHQLKPSISTSCLFTSSDNNNNNNDTSTTTSSSSSSQEPKQDKVKGSNVALICVPTRASLTHSWRKLTKTLNKCRECNLRVFFDGRECSQCGFVAHKKCTISLVIKCGRTQEAALLLQHQHQQHQNQQLRSVSAVSMGGFFGPMSVATATVAPMIALETAQARASEERLLLLRDRAAAAAAAARGKTKRWGSLGGSRASSPGPIFGQSIEGADTHQVLDSMRRFVYEIDTRGLSSKGIYRVSSIKSKVDKLCNYFDHNPSDLIDLSSFHPNIIANALKMYLRQLPEPLLTNELYDRFIALAKEHSGKTLTRVESMSPKQQRQQQQQQKQRQPAVSSSSSSSSTLISVCASSSSSSSSSTSSSSSSPRTRPVITSKKSSGGGGGGISRLHKSASEESSPQSSSSDRQVEEELRRIIDALPQVNKTILTLIMRHLRRVADMAQENQMGAKNLSIIFGPTLLSSGHRSSGVAIVDNIHQARAIELMITRAHRIFPSAQPKEEEGISSQSDSNDHNEDDDDDGDEAHLQLPCSV